MEGKIWEKVKAVYSVTWLIGGRNHADRRTQAAAQATMLDI